MQPDQEEHFEPVTTIGQKKHFAQPVVEENLMVQVREEPSKNTHPSDSQIGFGAPKVNKPANVLSDAALSEITQIDQQLKSIQDKLDNDFTLSTMKIRLLKREMGEFRARKNALTNQ